MWIPDFIIASHSEKSSNARSQKFGQYAKHWKEVHAIAESVKGSTLNSYLSIFDKHIEPEFKNMGMQAISSAEINAFRAKLLKKGLSKKTVRNILNLLSKVFTDAVDDQYLRHLPVIKKPVVSRKRKGRALQPAEVQALLANAETAEIQLIIKTAVLTGMRRAELFGLRWEDINWKADVIHVRQALFWQYGKHVRPAGGDCLHSFRRSLKPPFGKSTYHRC